MTWAGESGPSNSGLYVFTDDGSPSELTGNPGQVVMWNNGLPQFMAQSALTGVLPNDINQIGNVDTAGVTNGQVLKWNGSTWVPSSDIAGSGAVNAATPPTTDNAIVRWDGSTGDMIQNSNIIINDTDETFFPGCITVESGTFLFKTMCVENMVRISGNITTPSKPLLELIEGGASSAEFIHCINESGNLVIELRKNDAGDGIFRVREADGTSYFQVVDGQGIIRGFEAPTINPEPGYVFTIAGGVPKSGLIIAAGDAEGDIALKIVDQDRTFDILEVHTDNGQLVMGDTYANVLAASGIVYGIDNQHTGSAADFNTKNGLYRINGVPLNINHLNDVDTSTAPPSVEDSLVWDGTNWSPSGITIPDQDIQYSNAAVGAGTITTTSLTFVTVPSMSITPGAGTYLVLFSMTAAHNKSGQSVHGSIFANGVLVTGTIREIGGQSNNFGNFASHGIVTIADGQTITGRWRVSSNTGGGEGSSPGSRSLIAIKLA